MMSAALAIRKESFKLGAHVARLSLYSFSPQILPVRRRKVREGGNLPARFPVLSRSPEDL